MTMFLHAFEDNRKELVYDSLDCGNYLLPVGVTVLDLPHWVGELGSHDFTQPLRKLRFALRDGILTILKGSVWDGSTGGLDTLNVMAPSLIHDCFCETANYYRAAKPKWARQLRKDADYLFYETCRANEMSWWRSRKLYCYVALYRRFRW